MWRPYFVSSSWDPYANGVWALYPNAGYSWVSPYPWGWTPFHSGSWGFCPGTGWGWQPGGSWNGLSNTPGSTTTKGQPVRLPRPPVLGQSLVRVNAKPLNPSTLGSAETFVFRNDSAGLGIPRGSLGKLDTFSEQAAKHGSVNAAVHSAVAAPAQGNGRTANAGPAPSPRPSYANHSGSQASPVSTHAAGGTLNSSGTGSASSGRTATGSGRPR
jgi:hypothetical protein